MSSTQQDIKNDPAYVQADETGKQYILEESQSEEEALPNPSPPHREGDYIVHDPERYFYETEDANALLDEASSDVRREIIETAQLQDNATSHRRTVTIEDEATSEEIQDDALREDELIDMAQLKNDMDEPPMA